MHVVCMYVYTCICMYVGAHVCVGVLGSMFSVYLYLFVCVGCVLQRSESFGEIRTVAGDPDPIQIRAHCGPDTQAIRRPIHGMIRTSVLVRAVKTRRLFGSETVSFHVSVRSCSLPYLLLSVCVYMLYLLFHAAFGYMLSVWLLVLLHKTPMIAHFIYIVDRSLYQRHFMCW